MIEKTCAQAVRNQVLRAVEELSTALMTAESGATPEGCAKLKKGIGLAIGHIQVEILEPIYAEHPELDDLTPPQQRGA